MLRPLPFLPPLLLALATLRLAVPSAAHAATRSFVTLRDDGTLAGKIASPSRAARSVMKRYDAAGLTRPDVISLWTAFPQNRDESGVETLFVPVGNDVTGIGLEHAYGDDGTLPSAYAPLRAILLHNDFTRLEGRARVQGAPLEGFARYLFLLELSHLWGPALKVPAIPSVPSSEDALIGFLFHWSFWMDAGSSPAGGNTWRDNGDGTFTVAPQSPATVRFTPLDLYLMGLADPSEVPPFGVLEDAVPPAGIRDPFTGRAYARSSFPYWGSAPFTVSAKRRTLTIADVIAANGPRNPAKASGPLKLGIVLMAPAEATDDEVSTLEEPFEAIAKTLVPAFREATGGRGTLELVTARSVPEVDAGLGAEEPKGAGTGDGGSCALSAPMRRGRPLPMAAIVFVGLALATRRQSTKSASTSRATR